MKALRQVRRALRKAGVDVTRYQPNRREPSGSDVLQPWHEDTNLRKALEQPLRNSLVSPDRMFMLLQWLNYSLAAPGDVAEFGVWRGGTALLIAEHLRKHPDGRTIHLFDSFKGLPEANPSKDNFHREGDLADASETGVRRLLENHNNVRIHSGRFEETAHQIGDVPLCFAHIDADLHSSVLFATNLVFPRLSKGGVILYDDYGFRTCAGAKAAVDEFFSSRPLDPIYLTTGQCLVLKRC
jgi:O-methyltransferase